MTSYPTGRHRAGVIVVVDGRLALMDRVRPGSQPYSVVPGGGVEEGETFEQAAIREAKEELGLAVVVRSSQPTFVLQMGDHEQHYFLADAVGGTFGTGTGREMVAPLPEKGTYAVVLVPPEEAVRRDLWPFALSEALLCGFVTGSWPATTVELTDPRTVSPWRVRAGAVVIDDQDRVLLHRCEDGGPFYEIPGGGVEAGETVEQAVLRELEEEAGLIGEIVRPLALIWKDGRREHYFLLRTVGRSDRIELDVEEFFVPEWVPVAALRDLPVWPKRLGWRIAEWHASGHWPDSPIELTDTILDLDPACRW